MTTISMLAIGVNRHFNYRRYFSMVPVGPEGVNAFSKGFFEVAAAQNPKPQTVAIVAADAEFAKTAADGARENAKALGFKVIHDKTYPPRHDRSDARRARDPGRQCRRRLRRGLSAGYGRHRARGERDRPDAENVRRHDDRAAGHADQDAARPVDEWPRDHGKLRAGADLQLSRAARGADEIRSQGRRAADRSARPRLRAVRLRRRPDPGAGGGRQPRASTTTRSPPTSTPTRSPTVAGEISYNKNGDWAQPRTVFTQFQNVVPGNLDQFRDTKQQVILWPAKFKTGDIIYPYADAKK